MSDTTQTPGIQWRDVTGVLKTPWAFILVILAAVGGTGALIMVLRAGGAARRSAADLHLVVRSPGATAA